MSMNQEDGEEDLLKDVVLSAPKKILGDGSWGCVVEGEWRGQSVAVKQMKTHSRDGDKSMAKNLLKELWILRSLDHPHIVKVHGWCEAPRHEAEMSTLAIVMERMTCNLRDRYRAQGTQRLSLPSTVTIFLDVSSGLSFLHRKGFIHRDITPTNILLFGAMECPRAKLSDFGTAKMTLENMFRHTAVPGTLPYMSPESLAQHAQEQDNGDEPKAVYDNKHDIYSVGVVMLEVVTQKAPPPIRPAPDAERALEVFPLEWLARDHPLAPTINSCLSRSPNGRPSSQELQQRLVALSVRLRTEDHAKDGRYQAKTSAGTDVDPALSTMSIALQLLQEDKERLVKVVEERDRLRQEVAELKQMVKTSDDPQLRISHLLQSGFSSPGITADTLDHAHKVFTWEDVVSLGRVNSLCFATNYRSHVFVAASEKIDGDQTQMMLFFAPANNLTTWNKILGPKNSNRPEKLFVYKNALYVLVRSDDRHKSTGSLQNVILWRLLDQEKVIWEAVTTLPGRARSSLISTITRNLLVVCGGQDSAGTSLDEARAYNMDTDLWCDWPKLPRPLNGSSLVEFDEGLLLCTGRTREEGMIIDFSMKIYFIDPKNPQVWEEHASSPARRLGPALLSVSGNLIAAGGRGEYNEAQPDVFFWNAKNARWLALAPLKKPAAMSCLISCPDGPRKRLLLIGGYHEKHNPTGNIQSLTLP